MPNRRTEPAAARTRHPFDDVPYLPCRDDNHDPELWFPDSRHSINAGENICRHLCPVQPACLAWALKTGQRWGTWGGMNAGSREGLPDRERRALIAAGLPDLYAITKPDGEA